MLGTHRDWLSKFSDSAPLGEPGCALKRLLPFALEGPLSSHNPRYPSAARNDTAPPEGCLDPLGFAPAPALCLNDERIGVDGIRHGRGFRMQAGDSGRAQHAEDLAPR